MLPWRKASSIVEFTKVNFRRRVRGSDVCSAYLFLRRFFAVFLAPGAAAPAVVRFFAVRFLAFFVDFLALRAFLAPVFLAAFLRFFAMKDTSFL